MWEALTHLQKCIRKQKKWNKYIQGRWPRYFTFRQTTPGAFILTLLKKSVTVVRLCLWGLVVLSFGYFGSRANAASDSGSVCVMSFQLFWIRLLTKGNGCVGEVLRAKSSSCGTGTWAAPVLYANTFSLAERKEEWYSLTSSSSSSSGDSGGGGVDILYWSRNNSVASKWVRLNVLLLKVTRLYCKKRLLLTVLMDRCPTLSHHVW